MSRQPKVTRTIFSTNAHIITVSKADKSVGEIELVLPRTYENEDKVLKMAKKLYPNDELIYAGVVSYKEECNLYEMPEELFVKYATISNK